MTPTKHSLNDIRIRKELMPGDLGYVAYIHGMIYAQECGYGLNFEAYVLTGLQEFATQYDSEKDAVWVCEDGDKIVGFLIGAHRDEGTQLRYFIFLPEYRGLGLGKKLMKEFTNYMKERNYRTAYLWTTQEQVAAIELYKRFGFKLTAEKKSVAFDKELVEQRYDLILND